MDFIDDVTEINFEENLLENIPDNDSSLGLYENSEQIWGEENSNISLNNKVNYNINENVISLNGDECLNYNFQDNFENSILNTKYSKKIPRESKSILFSWMDEHIKNPYPNSQEFSMLMSKTGLSDKQLRIFFVNYRSRRLKRAPKKAKE